MSGPQQYFELGRMIRKSLTGELDEEERQQLEERKLQQELLKLQLQQLKAEDKRREIEQRLSIQQALRNAALQSAQLLEGRPAPEFLKPTGEVTLGPKGPQVGLQQVQGAMPTVRIPGISVPEYGLNVPETAYRPRSLEETIKQAYMIKATPVPPELKPYLGGKETASPEEIESARRMWEASLREMGDIELERLRQAGREPEWVNVPGGIPGLPGVTKVPKSAFGDLVVKAYEKAMQTPRESWIPTPDWAKKYWPNETVPKDLLAKIGDWEFKRQGGDETDQFLAALGLAGPTQAQETTKTAPPESPIPGRRPGFLPETRPVAGQEIPFTPAPAHQQTLPFAGETEEPGVQLKTISDDEFIQKFLLPVANELQASGATDEQIYREAKRRAMQAGFRVVEE